MICCYEMRKGRGSCVEPSSLKNFGSMFDAEAIHAQIPSNIEPNYQRTWCNGHKTGHASFLSSYIANLPLVSPMFVLGQEVGSHRSRDRLKKILHREHRQRLLDISVGDKVERDIEGSGLLNHRIDTGVHRLLVRGINDDGGSSAARGADLVGNRVELGQRATGEEYPGPLAGKGTGHGTADRTTRAVDDSHLVFQQHVSFLLSWNVFAHKLRLIRLKQAT